MTQIVVGGCFFLSFFPSFPLSFFFFFGSELYFCTQPTDRPTSFRSLPFSLLGNCFTSFLLLLSPSAELSSVFAPLPHLYTFCLCVLRASLFHNVCQCQCIEIHPISLSLWSMQAKKKRTFFLSTVVEKFCCRPRCLLLLTSSDFLLFIMQQSIFFPLKSNGRFMANTKGLKDVCEKHLNRKQLTVEFFNGLFIHPTAFS